MLTQLVRRVAARVRGWFRRSAEPPPQAPPPAVFEIVRTVDGVTRVIPQGKDERRAKWAWASLKAKRVDGTAEFLKDGVCRGTYTGPDA